MLAHRVAQQPVQFLLRGVQRSRRLAAESSFHHGSILVAPLRHSSKCPGGTFSMPFDQRLRRRERNSPRGSDPAPSGPAAAAHPDAPEWPSVPTRNRRRSPRGSKYSGLIPMRSRASTSRFSRFRPQRHREHSAHPAKQLRVPLQKRAQHRFGVAVGIGIDDRAPPVRAEFPRGCRSRR